MSVESGIDSHSSTKNEILAHGSSLASVFEPIIPRKLEGLPNQRITSSEAKEPQRKVNLVLWKSLVESYDHPARSLAWANVQGTCYAYSLCSMRPVIQICIVIILNDGRDGRATSATNPTYKSRFLAASTMRAEGDSQ